MLEPAATFLAVVMPAIWVGVERSVVVPSATWPSVLRPQHHAVPLVCVAQLWP